MNRNLMLRVTAPALAVGWALLAASLIGVWHINRIQGHLAELLSGDMASLESAQGLEMAVRRIRFNNILYLMDPGPARIAPIEAAEANFKSALEVAQASSNSPDEDRCVKQIVEEFVKYQDELAKLRDGVAPGKPAPQAYMVADQHPVDPIAGPCQEFLRLNKERMSNTANDARQAAIQANISMVILGVIGPLSGLVMGFGVARGLRQSIYRLNVRVQDMAQQLNPDVASMNIVADGDIQTLDIRMQQVVRQVEEVTARLQRQQRELLRAEQLAAVGQLAAGVAHEVRNPLTGIKMLVEATRRADNPRPLEPEDLRMIERELNRVEQTVKGLLDFARLPAPRQEVCDLKDVIVPAREVIDVRAAQQGVEIRLHAPGVTTLVSIDRDQIHKVLVNLMINALDAMPTGGQLDLSWKPPRDKTIQLTVSDTGVGIASDLKNKIFEPFATTKPTGTGLGLSMAARIIEEHHGTIQATPRTRGGACFIITLPEASSGTVS